MDEEQPKRTPPRSPGRTKGKIIPWADIQAAWEAGETNCSALGRKFGVKHSTIAKRAKEWTAKGQVKGHVSEAVRSNVISLATGKAIEHLGGSDAIETLSQEMANNVRAILDAQPKLVAKGMALLDRTVDRALNFGKLDENGKPVANQIVLGRQQGETEAVVDLLNAISKSTHDGRLINGLKDGTANADASEEKDAPKVDQAVLVVRKSA